MNSIKKTNYSHLYTTPQEIWIKNLKNVKRFVLDNNRLPCPVNDNNEYLKYLGLWVCSQKKYYNNDIVLCKEIMTYPEIKRIYEEFIIFMSSQ